MYISESDAVFVHDARFTVRRTCKIMRAIVYDPGRRRRAPSAQRNAVLTMFESCMAPPFGDCGLEQDPRVRHEQFTPTLPYEERDFRHRRKSLSLQHYSTSATSRSADGCRNVGRCCTRLRIPVGPGPEVVGALSRIRGGDTRRVERVLLVRIVEAPRYEIDDCGRSRLDR